MTTITNGTPGGDINKSVITKNFHIELDGNAESLETVKVTYEHGAGRMASVTVNQVGPNGTETKLASDLIGGSYNPVAPGQPVATFDAANGTAYGVYIENGGLDLDLKSL
jgi:hypothetical protein